MNPSEPTLALVCPTMGRPSLARLLDSFVPHMIAGDQVIIVGDGPQPAARELVAARCWSKQVLYCETPASKDWGATQFNFGFQFVRSDFIALMGDDDYYLDGAVASIRDCLTERCPHIFAVEWDGRRLSGSTECGGITLAQYVFPATWPPPKYPTETEWNDHIFISNVNAMYQSHLHHDLLIAVGGRGRGA